MCDSLFKPPHTILAPRLSLLRPGCRGCHVILQSLRLQLPEEALDKVGDPDYPLNLRQSKDQHENFWAHSDGIPTIHIIPETSRYAPRISIREYPIQRRPGELTMNRNAARGSLVECSRRKVSADALSPECMLLASKWLHQCLTSHQNCTRTMDDSPLPKRLVDVGGEQSAPRLIIPPPGSTGKYVALSHCWGGHQPLTTTTQTLADRQRGMPLFTMPLTFQHAAYVTRQLGFRYLWIDSLCILQDSKPDWEEQSGQMQNVYEGAAVTIAADAGPDSASGLSCPEKRKRLRGVSIPGENLSAVRDIDFDLSETPAHSSQPFQDDYWSLIRARGKAKSIGTTLQSRGWTFQERVLARRMLHFGEHELAWECSTATDCECNTASPSIVMRSWAIVEGSAIKAMPNAEPSHSTIYNAEWYAQPGSKSSMEVTGRWMLLVNQYSGRSLTYSSDKLAALSGLASRVAQSSSYTYLAGLWKENLEQTLLWAASRLPFQQSGLRHDEYQAPSWSWASLHSAEIFGGFDVEATIPLTVKHASCTPRSATNPFGAVQAGQIVVECDIATATVLEVILEFHPHRVKVVKVSDESPRFENGTITRPDVRGFAELDSDGTYMFIKVAKRGVGHSRWLIRGLVVRPSDRSPGAYERVGVHEYCTTDGEEVNVPYRRSIVTIV